MKHTCWKRLQQLIVAILVIMFLAQIAPRLLIHSNIEAFAGVEGPSMDFAGWAYVYTHHMVCSGPEAFFCTAVRVVEVSHLPPDETQGCRYPYTGKVRAYTLFGIPYDTISVNCNLGGHRQRLMGWDLIIVTYLALMVVAVVLVLVGSVVNPTGAAKALRTFILHRPDDGE